MTEVLSDEVKATILKHTDSKRPLEPGEVAEVVPPLVIPSAHIRGEVIAGLGPRAE